MFEGVLASVLRPNLCKCSPSQATRAHIGQTRGADSSLQLPCHDQRLELQWNWFGTSLDPQLALLSHWMVVLGHGALWELIGQPAEKFKDK